jgi:hypothetical protein
MYAKCVSGEEMEKRRQRTAFQDWKHEQLRGRGAIVAGNAAACGRGDFMCKWPVPECRFVVLDCSYILGGGG